MLSNKLVNEQLVKYGAESFSDIDTLSILLGLKAYPSGKRNLAKNILNYLGGLNNVLSAAQENPSGLPSNYNQYLFGLRLPFEITNRCLKSNIFENQTINSPDEVIKYLQHSMGNLSIEKFRIMYLNSQNQVITEDDISKGTVNAAAVYPREVIKSALRYNASSLIIAHNHPSGNPKPSKEDIRITNNLYDATNLFQMKLHDHIIIARNEVFSFSENDLLPELNIMKYVK